MDLAPLACRDLRAPIAFLGGAQLARAALLVRAVDRYLARDVDHRGEGLERGVGDRLEDLLVGPARLAPLFVEVHPRPALALDQCLQTTQQRPLALVAAVEPPGQGARV